MPKRKKKRSNVQIIRRISQILAFIFLPALFSSIFFAVKSMYLAIINQTFDIGTLLPQLLLLLAVLPVTILMGRLFCSFLCAFGAMADFIWFLAKKTGRKPIKIGEKTHRILRSLKYILLLFIVIMIWTLGWVQVDSMANPWNSFGMIASFTTWPSSANFFSIGYFLLLLILIGSFFIERFFCRYLCPLGAIFALISRPRIFTLKKTDDACGLCKVCTGRCSMGLPLYRYDRFRSGECIQCFDCISVCPRENIQAQIRKSAVEPLIAGIAATGMMVGLYYVGTIVGSDVAGDSETLLDRGAVVSESEGQYTDGEYEGTAAGYKGDTTVSVTVESGIITAIEILDTDDDGAYFNLAAKTIVSAILTAQSTDVDAVSGATFSSNAIINAVADALDEDSADSNDTPEKQSGRH